MYSGAPNLEWQEKTQGWKLALEKTIAYVVFKRHNQSVREGLWWLQVPVEALLSGRVC